MGGWTTPEREAGVSHPLTRAVKPRWKARSVNNILQLLVKQSNLHWMIPKACSTPNFLSLYKFLVPDKDINSHSVEGTTPPVITFQVTYMMHLKEKGLGCKAGLHPGWIR